MPGPSGYTAAFTRPDFTGAGGADDDVRQKTHRRAGNFPYDDVVDYGKSNSPDSAGIVRPDAGYHGPLVPKRLKPRDIVPKSVWESLADVVGIPTETMGDGFDPIDLEIDAVKDEFKAVFTHSLPHADGMDSRSLFILLTDLDPDYVAQKFAPGEDDEMRAIYHSWGEDICDPDEE